MENGQELLNNIIRFDQAVRYFADKNPQEFNTYLEFPAVARQQQGNEDATGFLQETLYYTALAMNALDLLNEPQADHSSEQFKKVIAPKLARNVYEFLNTEAKAGKPIFDTKLRALCDDLIAGLNKI